MSSESKFLARSWWCRGSGAVILLLLAVVMVFRSHHDLLFWAAIGFLVTHTVLALARYLRDRRTRIAVLVTHSHLSHSQAPRVIFSPPSPTSLIPLDFPPKIQVG